MVVVSQFFRVPARAPGGWAVANDALFSIAFWSLCALACWGPAWLGADLLARRRPGGDPLLAPAPSEVAARWLGRLLPFYGFLAPLLALFLGIYLVGVVSGRDAHFLYRPPVERLEQVPAACFGWTVVVLCSGLPYSAAALLVSGLYRRPRPWVVTASVVVLGSACLQAGAVVARVAGPETIVESYLSPATPLGDRLLFLLLVPSFWVGVTWGGGLVRLKGGSVYPEGDGLAAYLDLCWTAACWFLLLALLLGTAGFAIARRRSRRGARVPAEARAAAP